MAILEAMGAMGVTVVMVDMAIIRAATMNTAALMEVLTEAQITTEGITSPERQIVQVEPDPDPELDPALPPTHRTM